MFSDGHRVRKDGFFDYQKIIREIRGEQREARGEQREAHGEQRDFGPNDLGFE